MSIHEECGVFGVFSPNQTNVCDLVYYGLYALQHRGQEACGIVVNDDGLFYSHKDIGLVSDVFKGSVLREFPKGNMAVGHVRYGTTGGSSRKNCQPIEVNHQKGQMAIHITEICQMLMNSETSLNLQVQYFIQQAILKRLHIS